MNAIISLIAVVGLVLIAFIGVNVANLHFIFGLLCRMLQLLYF